MTASSVVRIVKHVDDRMGLYSITVDPSALSPLAKAMGGARRSVDGYVAEAMLVRLSEIGNPSWADELTFDSEAQACTVRCTRKLPLVHLVRRFEKRLAEPALLRRLLKSLPNDW